jgi:hypothetical protein
MNARLPRPARTINDLDQARDIMRQLDIEGDILWIPRTDSSPLDFRSALVVLFHQSQLTSGQRDRA